MSVNFQNGNCQFRIDADQLGGEFLTVVKRASNRVFVKDRAGYGEDVTAVGNKDSGLSVVKAG